MIKFNVTVFYWIFPVLLFNEMVLCIIRLSRKTNIENFIVLYWIEMYCSYDDTYFFSNKLCCFFFGIRNYKEMNEIGFGAG